MLFIILFATGNARGFKLVPGFGVVPKFFERFGFAAGFTLFHIVIIAKETEDGKRKFQVDSCLINAVFRKTGEKQSFQVKDRRNRRFQVDYP